MKENWEEEVDAAYRAGVYNIVLAFGASVLLGLVVAWVIEHFGATCL